jgi:hypothetical protein
VFTVFAVVNLVYLDLDGPAALEQPTTTDLAKSFSLSGESWS